MNIPTPAALGRRPTIALATPFGWIASEQLEFAASTGRSPVLLQRLGNEKARQQRGPRELREEACAALERAGWPQPWGLGAACFSTEEAAHFATAGYTWFSLELSGFLEPRAATMTLDELDAAIVELEDRGAFREGWHERYLAGRGGTAMKFDDETLARSAVRLGNALQEAEQMVQAIRASSSERGELPDLEVSIAGTGMPTTNAELAFLIAEMVDRGLIHNGLTRFAPSFGSDYEAGSEPPENARGLVNRFSTVCPSTAAGLSLPAELAIDAGSEAHWNAEHASILAWLKHLAITDPAQFRRWLTAARDEFPVAKVGWQVSLSEDDARFLPEVGDDALVSTFLETVQGRQLLLTTFQAVVDRPEFTGGPG
jgi:hypothetical protein